jgi:cob(I)alamin adenosyltransferase
MSWDQPFFDPIILPDGSELATLRDAATYITTLPKAEHDAEEWQAAMEALLLVAESGGPTMFARIGVMRALNRHAEREFNPSRKDTRLKRELKPSCRPSLRSKLLGEPK